VRMRTGSRRLPAATAPGSADRGMRALMRVGLKFARTPAAKQRLLLEALLRLGWARVLKAMPFARIAPSLGEPMRETPQALPREEERRVREISQAVRAVSRH